MKAKPVGRVTDNSGAKAALAGYEYQLDVSVYAALQLLLVDKSASRIVLEPSNDEDLEVDLERFTPGRVETSAQTKAGKLVVQVKHSSGEPWSAADLARLLNHGKRRRPAREHLSDPDTRFLLVTSAGVKGVARQLLVEDFVLPPEPLDLPAEIKKVVPGGSEGRVAVWEGLTNKMIDLEMRIILCDILKVSLKRWKPCRKKLREEAKTRMKGTTSGLWTREDLIATIREYGGQLASAPELEAFVRPGNFDEMLAMVRERNAIVIRGPSGAGKTVAALALCDRIKKSDGRMDLVFLGSNDEPASIRALSNIGPRLIYLEDPWGSYDLEKGAKSWTDQLPRLLSMARPDFRFVVTSRTDILREAQGFDALRPWSIDLDSEAYRNGELDKIYDKRMDLLRTDMQSKALEFRKEVLDELETPLELDLFFRKLQDGPEPGELDHVFLGRIKKLAHRSAVQDVVVKYLDGIDDRSLAAIVWALLKARGNFDRDQLVEIQRQLRASGKTPKGLDRVIDRLVATGHLRQPARTVSFAHPSVQEGFEAFIRRDWLSAEEQVVALVSALTTLIGQSRSWAIQTAAQIIGVVKGFDNSGSSSVDQFDEASRQVIDEWLEHALLERSVDFSAVLNLAANVGTGASNLSELARWFLKGFKRGGDWFDDDWHPPEFSPEWYERISADGRVPLVVDRFIREFFVNDHHVQYGRSFPILLDRLAPNTAPAFLDVTSRLVGSSRSDIVDVAVAGAVRNLDAYETVLAAALAELKEIEAQYAERVEEWRKIEDREVDSYIEEYHSSAGEDLGYASSRIVSGYVSAKRKEGRWRSLAQHPHAEGLVHFWAQDACWHDDEVEADEIRSLLTAAIGSDGEANAWSAATRHWRPEFEPLLLKRILAIEVDDSVRKALAECALRASPEFLQQCVNELRQWPAAVVRFIFDLRHASRNLRKAETKALQAKISSVLSNVELEIFKASGVKSNASIRNREALELLESAATTCQIETLDLIGPIMMASGVKSVAIVHRWLKGAVREGSAEKAASAAVVLDNAALVAEAKGHQRAQARTIALEHLLKNSLVPFSADILLMEKDPSALVRTALVAALKGRPHPEHLPVLVRLTGDTWSNADHHYGERPSFPIARAASEGLREYGALDDAICERLVASAIEREDRVLAKSLLTTAGRCGSAAIRGLIWQTAMRVDLAWVRVDAIDALTDCLLVEADILSQAAIRLNRLAGPLAVSSTILLTRHLQLQDAVAVLEGVGRAAATRALLLIGVVEMNSKHPKQARQLLNLLDDNHPVRDILDLAGRRLPPSVLDDLGRVRLRHFVKDRLGAYFLKD